MLGAVGEEPVDDHADDGEEEDDQAPEELVQGRAVGLQDLDCRSKLRLAVLDDSGRLGAPGLEEGRNRPQRNGSRTEHQDVKDQDDEAQHAAAGAILPGVAGRGGGDVLRDGRGEGEGGQAELEEEGEEEVVEHLCSRDRGGGGLIVEDWKASGRERDVGILVGAVGETVVVVVGGEAEERREKETDCNE